MPGDRSKAGTARERARQNRRNGPLPDARRTQAFDTLRVATQADILAAPSRVLGLGAGSGISITTNAATGIATFETTGAPPTGAAGGDLAGTYPAPTLNPAVVTTAAKTVLDDATVAAMVDTLGGAASTGTGGLVRATSPTLVTPAIGTPASGVATNLTGTAAGLTAGNVTTNANLTGDVTSVGNATTIPTSVISAAARTVTDDATVAAMVDTLGGAAATGTGGLVRATSPTLVTPALGTPTALVLTNATGLPTAGLVNDAVTNVKLANMAQSTIKGRAAGAGTGDPTDLTVAEVTTLMGLGAMAFLDSSEPTDGDKGDVVVTASGLTWMLDSAVVTAAAKTVLDDATVAAMVNTLGGAVSVGTGGLVRESAVSIARTFAMMGA